MASKAQISVNYLLKFRQSAKNKLFGPVFSVLLILTAVGFTSYPIATTNDTQSNGDRRQYLELAKNVATQGSFAMRVRQPIPETVFWRPPAYPTFLGICLLASGEVNSPEEDLLQGDLPVTKRLYFLLQILLAAVTAYCAWGVLGTMWVPTICFALVAWNPLLAYQCSRFLSELFSAFWLAVVSLLLMLATKNRSVRIAGAAGLCCGILSLSRPTFLYFAPVATLWLFFMSRAKSGDKSKHIRSAAIFLLGFIMIAVPWMARNHALCGRLLISDRGGFNLYLRGLHDTMSQTEFRASFFAWSKLRVTRKILKKRFKKEDYQRILKSQENSFLAQAKTRAFALYRPDEDFEPHRAAGADSILTIDGLNLILSHPVRHVLLTLPIAIRSTFVVRGIGGPLLFASLCLLFLVSLYRRNLPLSAVLLPSVFAFAFHAVVTTGVPRYSIPIIPFATLAFLISISMLFSSARRLARRAMEGQSPLNGKDTVQ